MNGTPRQKYSGTACKCGNTLRFIDTNTCVDCVSRSQNAYRQSKKGKAVQAKYSQSDKRKAASRKYAQSTRGKQLLAVRLESEETQEQIERNKRTNLLKKYRLTVEHFETMKASQNGLCAICGEPPNEGYKHLCVDHCHNTGVVRGLLCQKCNKALGGFNDNPALLQTAIEYLTSNR